MMWIVSLVAKKKVSFVCIIGYLCCLNLMIIDLEKCFECIANGPIDRFVNCPLVVNVDTNFYIL